MLHRSLDLYPLLIVDNKPATVWLIGEVDSSWFKLRGGPLAVVSIKIGSNTSDVLKVSRFQSTGSGEYASVEAFKTYLMPTPSSAPGTL
ncbi:hypothetical protein SCP_0113560 [Sparassis crispa]|uniref:Uncharacterized protein n=1 Tax=Sparassis crispa TaxID=139825 RepID=A0A401G8I4_9APHY|nr:hypothetical protein SCP_0113560 [Sparassis crispa]GBE78467.1 hypothetical protein SCP_0113560 [Sparassis crispa]